MKAVLELSKVTEVLELIKVALEQIKVVLDPNETCLYGEWHGWKESLNVAFIVRKSNID